MSGRQRTETGPGAREGARLRLHDAGEGVWALSGSLTFESVPERWREILALLDGASGLTLDLAGVTRTDSAGLALLVECMREARRKGVEVRFRSIPEQLLAVAGASRLQDGLPRA